MSYTIFLDIKVFVHLRQHHPRHSTPQDTMEVFSTASPPPGATDGQHNRHLADVVYNNLANQQDWTQMRIHGDGHKESEKGHPRILLSGLPPRRLYIHPDEQIEVLRAEKALGNGTRIPQPPELEWVLPVHLVETPTVSQLAAVFDSITAVPPGEGGDNEAEAVGDEQWRAWRGARRGKRLVLAVVQDDSSVSYYLMHDGIVKPRQN